MPLETREYSDIIKSVKHTVRWASIVPLVKNKWDSGLLAALQGIRTVLTTSDRLDMCELYIEGCAAEVEAVVHKLLTLQNYVTLLVRVRESEPLTVLLRGDARVLSLPLYKVADGYAVAVEYEKPDARSLDVRDQLLLKAMNPMGHTGKTAGDALQQEILNTYASCRKVEHIPETFGRDNPHADTVHAVFKHWLQEGNAFQSNAKVHPRIPTEFIERLRELCATYETNTSAFIRLLALHSMTRAGCTGVDSLKEMRAVLEKLNTVVQRGDILWAYAMLAREDPIDCLPDPE